MYPVDECAEYVLVSTLVFTNFRKEGHGVKKKILTGLCIVGIGGICTACSLNPLDDIAETVAEQEARDSAIELKEQEVSDEKKNTVEKDTEKDDAKKSSSKKSDEKSSTKKSSSKKSSKKSSTKKSSKKSSTKKSSSKKSDKKSSTKKSSNKKNSKKSSTKKRNSKKKQEGRQ